MPKSLIPSNRLLRSPWFKTFTQQNKLNIFDAGAREQLFSPFDQLPADLFKVYGFEPDREEAERLAKAYPAEQREYFGSGLWQHSGTIKLSYAKLAGNSSVHPPNMGPLSETFPPIHWENREPKASIDIEVKSVDELTQGTDIDCDLLKVDTQGSEYEIVKGAQRMLKDGILFVLLETWTWEVHKGQHLMGEILEWMTAQGYTLVRVFEGADWHRKEVVKLEEVGLRTLVGLDLLFVRNDFEFGSKEKCTAKAVKGAALAELYGFPDLGLQILDRGRKAGADASAMQEAEKIIIGNWKTKPVPFFFRAARKLLYMAGYHLEKVEPSPYAPLH